MARQQWKKLLKLMLHSLDSAQKRTKGEHKCVHGVGYFILSDCECSNNLYHAVIKNANIGHCNIYVHYPSADAHSEVKLSILCVCQLMKCFPNPPCTALSSFLAHYLLPS